MDVRECMLMYRRATDIMLAGKRVVVVDMEMLVKELQLHSEVLAQLLRY